MCEKYEPTDKDREKVKTLTSFGVTQPEIAQYLAIDPKTLRLHFRNELDKASIDANENVARVLYEKAVVERETSAVIFWLKTRAGWREMDKLAAQLVEQVNEMAQKLKGE